MRDRSKYLMTATETNKGIGRESCVIQYSRFSALYSLGFTSGLPIEGKHRRVKVASQKVFVAKFVIGSGGHTCIATGAWKSALLRVLTARPMGLRSCKDHGCVII